MHSRRRQLPRQRRARWPEGKRAAAGTENEQEGPGRGRGRGGADAAGGAPGGGGAGAAAGGGGGAGRRRPADPAGDRRADRGDAGGTFPRWHEPPTGRSYRASRGHAAGRDHAVKQGLLEVHLPAEPAVCGGQERQQLGRRRELRGGPGPAVQGEHAEDRLARLQVPAPGRPQAPGLQGRPRLGDLRGAPAPVLGRPRQA
mmetsp:Transcript_4355/g.12738  ORF Transcript_4355/g.12738 Transcript_4355/m.12738 type:complete len:200 (+) Transcript_4355:156-755(+)